MSNEAQIVQNYLQKDCNDFWSVEEKKNIIYCYFSSQFRFSIFREEDGDWRISGEDMNLNMVYNLAIILNENY